MERFNQRNYVILFCFFNVAVTLSHSWLSIYEVFNVLNEIYLQDITCPKPALGAEIYRY